MKYRTMLSTAAFAVAMMTSPVTGNAQEQTVKIATEGAYAPWNFTEGGTLKGFDIDLAKDLCARAKLTCEIIPQAWDGIIPGLNAGKYDAIIAAMGITEKRRQAIDFTIPYARARNGFFAEKGSDLAKLPGTGDIVNLAKADDATKASIEKMRPLLKGKVIGVQTSSTNATFLEQYFKNEVEVRQYKTSEEAELDLLSGRVDAIVQSNISLATTKKDAKFDAYEIYGPTFFNGPFGAVGIGLRKGDEKLKASLDKAVQEAIDDGTVKRLAQQWFAVDVTPVGE
ncbi:transporter substrate-binding domain-containing protein [Rhizobium rhizogenes]|uniref:transporter substrate-binding domain-containing protein n=1 Tax=Rhizobium rhizogenes TaxID=359 RepID=UPI0022B74E7F|nr:transporter substrate-binding domain-containing protein [Rhizobium rhizogenes]MCZ7448267.1 transporter substrate-binding domain-containing protein [Rhizobium rhizogenes]MCZ7465700.1 transporter substrate-binding domain-containing protein [Rhizobium rhizogenes]